MSPTFKNAKLQAGKDDTDTFNVLSRPNGEGLVSSVG